TGVWATCLLFFQTFLLAGYAYAHLISTRLSRSQQAKLHSVVLGISLALLCVMASRWPSPVTPGAAWQPADARHPVGMILLILAASIGIPFLLLSTTASLLQRWFTYTHPGKSPYRFYALSNLGSLLGLLTYPFVVERLLRLHTQAWMWSVMFAAYAAGMVLCARQMAASPLAAIPDIHESRAETAPSLTRKMLWVALAGLASMMLLATTHIICQDVAVVPLLWVLPLAVYLLTFILCFGGERLYQPGVFHFLLLLSGGAMVAIYHGSWLAIGVHIGIFLP